MCPVVQLKVRASLMPEVVSAVEALEAAAGGSRVPEYVGAGGRPKKRSWAVSPKLFPCELSSEAQTAISEVRELMRWSEFLPLWWYPTLCFGARAAGCFRRAWPYGST